jgi:hypothetical protein
MSNQTGTGFHPHFQKKSIRPKYEDTHSFRLLFLYRSSTGNRRLINELAYKKAISKVKQKKEAASNRERPQ